jgi:hypothetical protein
MQSQPHNLVGLLSNICECRPSKFPEVEEQLQKWLQEMKRDSVMFTDAMIRQKAKETAKKLHIPDNMFKASSGWVENFKHRHGIRGGIWNGDRANTSTGTLGDGEPGLSSLHSAFDGPSEIMEEENP